MCANNFKLFWTLQVAFATQGTPKIAARDSENDCKRFSIECFPPVRAGDYGCYIWAGFLAPGIMGRFLLYTGADTKKGNRYEKEK